MLLARAKESNNTDKNNIYECGIRSALGEEAFNRDFRKPNCVAFTPRDDVYQCTCMMSDVHIVITNYEE